MKMKLYARGRRDAYYAEALFEPEKKEFIILKGAKVLDPIGDFGGSDKVRQLREENVKNGFLVNDLVFRSPSKAACFLTGQSKNGLLTWKNELGDSLKAMKQKSNKEL